MVSLVHTIVNLAVAQLGVNNSPAYRVAYGPQVSFFNLQSSLEISLGRDVRFTLLGCINGTDQPAGEVSHDDIYSYQSK